MKKQFLALALIVATIASCNTAVEPTDAPKGDTLVVDSNTMPADTTHPIIADSTKADSVKTK